MIRTVIVDDEQRAINLLQRLIVETNTNNVEVIKTANSVEEGYKVITQIEPDLVFLDVEMLDGTGFNLLEKFKDISFEVIFTTAYDKYAIDAFKHNAIDYLLKPIDIDDLNRALLKIKKISSKEDFENNSIKNLLNSLKEKSSKKIAINSSNKLQLVDRENIVLIQADHNYSIIHLLDNIKIMSTHSIKHYEKLFENEQNFFRANRSNIINFDHVEEYVKNKEVINLTGNHTTELARRKKKDFLIRLKAYADNF